jgi:hypothetical protein
MKTPKIHRFFYGLFFTVIISIGLIYTACEKTEKEEPFKIPRAENGLSKQGQTYFYQNESSGSSDESDELEEYDEDNDTLYKFEKSRVYKDDRINPISEKSIRLPFSTDAHKKYLNDPLVFKNVPDGGIPEGPTAVVGSYVCDFYPAANVSSMDDLKKLPEGERIPFAAIIPLGDKLVCKDAKYSDLFEFQQNYNHFYKTTWKGKQGIVFGADLYGDAEHGIRSSNKENRVNSLLYKDNGSFGSFYPITGYEDISEDIQKDIRTNGLVFQEVKQAEYRLDADRPDDMMSLYIKAINNYKDDEVEVTPIFVTTDVAAHANHLVFDRMLQYCEENYFFPQLVAVVDEYINAIEQKKEQTPKAVYDTSKLYFQTAQALLALAPKRVEVERSYYSDIVYKKVNAANFLNRYPEQVAGEIEQINNASGINQSVVFPGMNEDYSQYKVRGHYTKNGVLGAYFRALMWFGRINFNLGGESESAKAAAKSLAPVALFITDITENSPEIKKLWQSLFDPITELIGISDDISFYELAPLWKKIKGSGFSQWYNNPAKLDNFISREYKELRTPVISGFSLFSGAYDGGSAPEDRRPPVGWRLFGQRYTLDNEIHHFVSSPRIYGRDMVSGLDIMKVFGSKTAANLLKEKEYPKYAGLEKTLGSLQQSAMKIKDDYWFSTYYTNILYQIKTQAVFENGAGFYFTEKPGWNLKAMNSAHGTWAELRHDTILYAKSSGAERAGGGPDITFRTEPLPKPVHYIEPNVPFWITSAIGIQKLYEVLEKYDYLDSSIGMALSGMHGVFVKAAEISKLEADDKEVSATDIAWIGGVPRRLARITMYLLSGSDWVNDIDALRMALVADVFTNAETGLVLETAVGIPFRLYVPLNDKQGGKRIAIGYGFSYFEFAQPMSNRLNNEQWKAIVYGNNDMNNYLPFWMKGKVNRAK